jgi:hypothetical protein
MAFPDRDHLQETRMETIYTNPAGSRNPSDEEQAWADNASGGPISISTHGGTAGQSGARGR